LGCPNGEQSVGEVNKAAALITDHTTILLRGKHAINGAIATAKVFLELLRKQLLHACGGFLVIQMIDLLCHVGDQRGHHLAL
jgi:hypothetical protein